MLACSDGSVFVYRHSDRHISARYVDDVIEKYKKMVDKNGKKKYNSDREAHLAALDQIRKDYGISYEER